MEKFEKIVQFVLACTMFLCVVTEIIAHTFFTRTINSIIGFLAAGFFALLAWGLVRITWKELREELS